MTFIAAGSSNPLIPPVGEIIIGLIAFAIVAFVLMKFVWPQFEKAYADRTEAIEGGMARAEAAQKEAQAALAKYNEQLSGAREEAGLILEGARAEGQQIVDDMRSQAQSESDRIVARGDEQLQAQRQQVVSELRQQIGSLSVGLASRIVGESLQDDARTAATIDRFLDELDKVDSVEAAQVQTAGSYDAPAQDTLFGTDGEGQR
ncbi:F0F1 ATP synthase subunit B [Epidermidibacterium keratini]|uniref:ATP synthase subunit b n=1 Tax=Epidermidibacterium keratini TaxID=1891644 RepID=A0A7L4YRK0_9ACTN|nr:F0F1 ATP synthase subunit B [Epidermidibacterium keratini]QHC01702.1 F0F1 ATP synthase subunit B [Epidermidibacterium keratini]